MSTIKQSPWGRVQTERQCGPGITVVTTASHGGYKLDSQMNKLIPAMFRRNLGWYEEDCEAAIVEYFLNLHFDLEHRLDENAHIENEKILKNYFPEEWERHTGKKLDPSESTTLRRKIFDKETVNKYVCFSCHGLDSFVLAWCRRKSDGAEKQFLVRTKRYRERDPFHVVDENIDLEVTNEDVRKMVDAYELSSVLASSIVSVPTSVQSY